MRKETLWSIFIVAMVLVVGVVATQWDVWLSQPNPVTQSSEEDNSNDEQIVTEPIATHDSSTGTEMNAEETQSRTVDGSTGQLSESHSGSVVSDNFLSDPVNEPPTVPISNPEKGLLLSTEKKGQRTRIIVKEPVVVDGVDVMAELKDKVLSEDDGIQTTLE